MSSAFELPRAAVRTALVRLEHEGLIEREPHPRRARRLVTEQEAVEILEARAALEGLAASQAAKNITPGVAELRAVLSASARRWRARTCWEPPTSTPSCTRRSSSCPATPPPSA